MLTGNAVCGVEAGQTTLTWTIFNTTGSPVAIATDARRVTFSPNPVPAGGTSTGTEELVGPADVQEITETVSLGAPGGPQLSDTVTVPDCTGPAAPPDIAFTFTNEPSVETAAVGDTVEYSYCGENTSDVDLEVVRVVDDQYGVLEVPEAQTIVSPGETLCITDIGLPVSYVAVAGDAGTTIVNNAVVTVQTVGDDPQAFQAADPAEVEVLATGEQVEPTTTTLPVTALANTGSNLATQLGLGGLALFSGSLLLVIGRRRSTS